jgi:catechol 2,3-dioxygenase-like lactoylglutathione lyase family enzyme
MIHGLHHAAYRCRDSAETRAFYEDFLGLQLAHVLPIHQTKTGRDVTVLHTFYRMGDGSFIAFFEDPTRAFDFKAQHDFDLHIALEVDEATLIAQQQKALDLGMEVRGISDHGFIHSVYFRDPNGYVVELTVVDKSLDGKEEQAKELLKQWQVNKTLPKH